MEGLHHLEVVILMLALVLALTMVAGKIFIPYPILLVIGGLVLSVVPGLPAVTLDPDLVFLVFLPPILWAAYFTSWREFRGNLRPITLLAVGLVLATTAAVAAVAHAMLPVSDGQEPSRWAPLSLRRMPCRRRPSDDVCGYLVVSSRSSKEKVW